MFYVYILKCKDDSYYTGHTDDLERRLADHAAGLHEGYTSKRLPLELVYQEVFFTRIEALEAERKIKTWSRKKKETLIYKGWEGIIALNKDVVE